MKNKKKKDKKLKGYPHVLLDSVRTKSRFAEAYRTLRTNIYFSVMDKKVRSLVITSAGQSEGKTVTTFNLAYTMSQAGKSVLVIDADLRKPMLSKFFKVGKSPGLTGLLSDIFNTDIHSGSLEDFSTNDLFKLISLQKKTGILELRNEKDHVEVHFLNGELYDIRWNTRPEEKKLASVLVENGLLSIENAKVALHRRKDTGQRLGRVCVNMGMLTEEQLKGPLTIHIMESLQIISRMKIGTFQFDEQRESQMSAGEFDMEDLRTLYQQRIGSDETFLYLRNKIEAAIVKSDTPNLFLLPSGVIPPNPSELLGSEQMSFLIRHLKKKFDTVVIDTPPILPASDALLVAPQTDGVALVVKAGLLKRKMIAKAVEQLRRTQADLLGVILNRVDTKREGYYKYYQKYYSKYHVETA